MQEIETGTKLYGAMTYYQDDTFLMVDYNDRDGNRYGKKIHIDTCEFSKNSAGTYSYVPKDNDYLSVDNSMYNASVTRDALQDIHYEPGIGVFIGGYVNEGAGPIHYVLRVDIDSYIKSGIAEDLSPTEIYLLRYQNAKFESESPSVSEYGELLIAPNMPEDILGRTTNLFFVHEQ